jgi:hypothetical protein
MAGCCDYKPQDYYISNMKNVYDFRVQNLKTANFVNGKGGNQNFNSIVYKDELLTDEDCKTCCDKFQTFKVIYDGTNVNYNFSIDIKAYSASNGEGLSIYYTPKYSLNLIYHNVDFAYIENESLSRVLVGKNSYSELLDSVRLNDEMYYNVFKFKATVPTSKLYPKELYYNKEQGVVGYLLSDSTLFNLQN